VRDIGHGLSGLRADAMYLTTAPDRLCSHFLPRLESEDHLTIK
jgi:hypothetical protein